MEVDDDFATFGTPLEPVTDDAAIRKKPIALEEQIVTDENGRRRFHGAFTGGFSAGYFNTAGSRDGWSPAHFKSSRANRKEKGPSVQRPEDFMDDEDRGEYGIAPQGLQTVHEFRVPAPTQGGPKRKPQSQKEGLDEEEEAVGPIPGDPVLDQILKPTLDTIGTRLLRQMGWRQGQGVGPRLSKHQKSQHKVANHRMFGRTLAESSKPSQGDDSSGEEVDGIDPKYQDFLFAPDDIPKFVIKPKENLFGIGYQGLDRTTLITSSHVNLFEPTTSSLKVQKTHGGPSSRLKIKGQAFGVGAYEEEDADIYARDDMGQYDFALTRENEGKSSKGKRAGKSRWAELEHLSEILAGFSVAEKSSKVCRSFPLPDLPKNFVPKAGVKKSRFEQEPALKTSNPTPRQRQTVLESQTERLQPKVEPTSSLDQIQSLLSANSNQLGNANLLGAFHPFARNPDKQKRYDQFLVCIKNNRRDALAILQPKTMTEWEREREKVEFNRAALLYRPMSGTMNSKFVSAGSSEDAAEDKTIAADTGEGAPTARSDAKKAAQMKMFGKLTHDRVEWHPDRLLCIRFNVKNPFNDNSVVGVSTKEASKFELFNFGEGPKASETPKDTLEIKAESAETMKDLDIPGIEESKVEKPPLDLFKSIFLDSSSESEDEGDGKEAKPKEPLGPKEALFGTELEKAAPPKPWEEKKENVLRNPHTPKGIFANIDFDELNRKKTLEVRSRPTAADFFDPEDIEDIPKTSPIKEGKTPVETMDAQDMFGPAKPDSLRPKFTLKRKQPLPEEDLEGWVEEKEEDGTGETNKKKKKSKKADSKKKKAKKKSKKAKKSSAKKKKKKKSKISSSESSSGSSSD